MEGARYVSAGGSSSSKHLRSRKTFLGIQEVLAIPARNALCDKRSVQVQPRRTRGVGESQCHSGGATWPLLEKQREGLRPL